MILAPPELEIEEVEEEEIEPPEELEAEVFVIFKATEPDSWSDSVQGDIVSIEVNDATFIDVSDNVLSIDDLSDPSIEPGTYYIDVTVIDEFGNTSTRQVTLLIQEPIF